MERAEEVVKNAMADGESEHWLRGGKNKAKCVVGLVVVVALVKSKIKFSYCIFIPNK